MAEEAPNYVEIMQKNRYAALAAYSEKQKDEATAVSALELLAVEAEGFNPKNGFVQGSAVTPQGRKRVLEDYLPKYVKAQKESEVSKLAGVYGLEGYVQGDTLEAIKREIGKHADETYGSIAEKVADAKYVLDGKDTHKFKESEVKAAEKTIEKYQNIMQVLNGLESIYMEKIKVQADERTHVRKLDKIAADIKAHEKEEREINKFKQEVIKEYEAAGRHAA